MKVHYLRYVQWMDASNDELKRMYIKPVSLVNL